MPKICDNKSVGVVVREGDNFVMILRKTVPIAYAFVAGHCDGQPFSATAVKELAEESGLHATGMELRLKDTFGNPCKREGGSWHEWEVYRATHWSGALRDEPGKTEVSWKSLVELQALAERTKAFAEKLEIPIYDLFQITQALQQDPAWLENPGLEPIWVMILERIAIL